MTSSVRWPRGLFERYIGAAWLLTALFKLPKLRLPGDLPVSLVRGSDHDEEVRRAASLFREAIVRCARGDLPTFRNFPHGSCGDTSILLGQHLYDRSLGLWEYAGGERELDLHSHAWIEQDGLIVDITADQFEDMAEPVIVTRDRSWHRQFVTWSRGLRL